MDGRSSASGGASQRTVVQCHMVGRRGHFRRPLRLSEVELDHRAGRPFANVARHAVAHLEAQPHRQSRSTERRDGGESPVAVQPVFRAAATAYRQPQRGSRRVLAESESGGRVSAAASLKRSGLRQRESESDRAATAAHWQP